MYTKVEIFNLALGALLLNKQIIDPDTEKTIEARTLNLHYNTAFRNALADMNLDSTSVQAELELLEEDPTDQWLYAYKYPSKCALFRRIQSEIIKDNRTTHVLKQVLQHNGKKVIFSNKEDAIGEFVTYDVNLNSLSAPAGLAIAYKLASLSAPLIVGKGASSLRKEISANYIIAKAEAQQLDRLENFNFDEDQIISEFVEARTT